MKSRALVLLLAVLWSAACDVFLTFKNHAPVAVAGTDQSVVVGTAIILDGSSSKDPDGDSVTYKWQIQTRPAGSKSVLLTPLEVKTKLTPDAEGTWIISLTVSDGLLSSQPALVQLQVTPKPQCQVGSDCGTGSWECTPEQTCSCPGIQCSSTSCIPAGGCCQDTDCGSDQICDQNACVAGKDGNLVINGTACTLNGIACPASKIKGDAGSWTLLDNSLEFTNVTIQSAALNAPAIDAGGAGGSLVINAKGSVLVDAASTIIMSGWGYGGGGGGGGRQYCDTDLGSICNYGAGGGTGSSVFNGEQGAGSDLDGGPVPACFQGYNNSTVGGGKGGRGGGEGGASGHNGGSGAEGCCPLDPGPFQDGAGGNGGGPFGGWGGTDLGKANQCNNMVAQCSGTGANGNPAESGFPGGYAGTATNGDSSTDDNVLVGSGGGGGAGGDNSNKWCCGAADGGNGGSEGGLAHVGCTGGGGGGGGGAGGGSIVIHARNIAIAGNIQADGAGKANLGGGFGAGGGILLYAKNKLTLDPRATIRSLGGYSDLVGTTMNGGTIKLFYKALDGVVPSDQNAGRVFAEQLP